MKKYIILIILLSLCIHNFFAQDNSLDNKFLDNPQDDSPGSFNNFTSTTSVEKSLFNVRFAIGEHYSHSVLHSDTVHNPQNLLFISPLENVLFLDSVLHYQNKNRWFSFELNNRVFFSLKDKENKLQASDVDTFFSNELVSANMSFFVWKRQLQFRVGKVLDSNSVAFITSPSDPLFRSYGTGVAFARNKLFKNVYTKNLSVPVRERGSGGSLGTVGIGENQIGSWLADVQLIMPWFTLRQAYLPKIETGFEEFDRPYHASLTSFTLTYFPDVTPSILFFYDKTPFIGFSLSAGIGEIVTLHFDSSVSFENELPIIQEDGTQALGPALSVQHYKVQPHSIEGVFFEAVIGTTITPVYEGQSLFSILFELYYNGRGLLQNQWEKQIEYLQDIEEYRTSFKNMQAPLSAFSGVYTGMLGTSLQYYNPLKVRPVYLSLRLSRDDVFKGVWNEQIDVASVLVYSPFDTSFAWITNIDWVGNKIISVGTEFSYYFGMPHGAFTEIPQIFTFSIYAELEFLKI